MDAEMVTLASSAATALIGAMTTDGWSQAKAGALAIWRRHRPGQAETVEDALESARNDLIAADDVTREGIASRVEGRWQGRWEAFLEEHPDATSDVAKLIEQLHALIGHQDMTVVTQHVWAGRDAYTAGRDQHITRPPEE